MRKEIKLLIIIATDTENVVLPSTSKIRLIVETEVNKELWNVSKGLATMHVEEIE
jgi:hypothetical protein